MINRDWPLIIFSTGTFAVGIGLSAMGIINWWLGIIMMLLGLTAFVISGVLIKKERDRRESETNDIKEPLKEELSSNPRNWIIAHESMHGIPPPVEPWLTKLNIDARVGEPLRRSVSFQYPGIQTWAELKPSERQKLLALVVWSGRYATEDDFLCELNKLWSGVRGATIQPNETFQQWKERIIPE